MSSPGEAGANANPAVFSRPAVVLHWLIALFIACGFTLGAYMVDLHASPTKVRLFAYHKWIGITVLGWCWYAASGASPTGRPPSCPCPAGSG